MLYRLPLLVLGVLLLSVSLAWNCYLLPALPSNLALLIASTKDKKYELPELVEGENNSIIPFKILRLDAAEFDNQMLNLAANPDYSAEQHLYAPNFYVLPINRADHDYQADKILRFILGDIDIELLAPPTNLSPERWQAILAQRQMLQKIGTQKKQPVSINAKLDIALLGKAVELPAGWQVITSKYSFYRPWLFGGIMDYEIVPRTTLEHIATGYEVTGWRSYDGQHLAWLELQPTIQLRNKVELNNE